eukprot:764151-Hanusia_phi.AAC.12
MPRLSSAGAWLALPNKGGVRGKGIARWGWLWGVDMTGSTNQGYHPTLYLWHTMARIAPVEYHPGEEATVMTPVAQHRPPGAGYGALAE